MSALDVGRAADRQEPPAFDRERLGARQRARRRCRPCALNTTRSASRVSSAAAAAGVEVRNGPVTAPAKPAPARPMNPRRLWRSLIIAVPRDCGGRACPATGPGSGHMLDRRPRVDLNDPRGRLDNCLPLQDYLRGPWKSKTHARHLARRTRSRGLPRSSSSTSSTRRGSPARSAGLIRSSSGADSGPRSNRCVKPFDVKIEWEGDGGLILFGYPEVRVDAAEAAVRSGLALIDAVGAVDAVPGVRLELRVGIASGFVTIDLLSGALESMAINKAERLKTTAGPNEVAVADDTRRLVRNFFEYADLGTFQLKGFDEPTRVWRVMRESAVVSRFAAQRQVDSPGTIIGRADTLARLSNAWADALGGHGAAVCLVGDAGMGKSRLARATLDRAEQDGAVVLEIQCTPSTGQQPAAADRRAAAPHGAHRRHRVRTRERRTRASAADAAARGARRARSVRVPGAALRHAVGADSDRQDARTGPAPHHRVDRGDRPRAGRAVAAGRACARTSTGRTTRPPRSCRTSARRSANCAR